MQTQQQVCSLGQAKRLKELGVKGASAFYWDGFSRLRVSIFSIGMFEEHAEVKLTENIKNYECFHAYTVAELGVMLSPVIDLDTIDIPNFIMDKYGDDVSNIFNPALISDILIWALETNLITAETCNQRLSQ